MKNLFFLAGLFLLLNACQETAPSKDINKQVNITKIDTISYELKNISKEKGDCDEESNQCVTALMDYVVITKGLNEKASARINAFVEKEMKGNAPSMEINLDSFILEGESFFKEFPESAAGYSMEVKQEVVFNTSEIFIVEENLYSFTGGAHGNYGTIYYNFDAANGELIALNDILRTGFEEALKIKAEELFKAEYLEEGATEYSEMGFYFENDQFTLTNNFAIMKDGLKFLYNPYEVAPYALGQQEILIPYTSLKDLIKPDGLLVGF